MRVTSKGQVTIPLAIRHKLGIEPYTEVDFVAKNNKVYLVKIEAPNMSKKLNAIRGTASVSMSTDEIMRLTRT